MKHWLSEFWWVLLVVLLAAILLIGGVVLDATIQVREENICKAAGYVGRNVLLDGTVICYGYVEGNQLIVIEIDTVKERQ